MISEKLKLEDLKINQIVIWKAADVAYAKLLIKEIHSSKHIISYFL